ncbi:hypothetical protein [Geodermatophilus saharensis]|uniref:hypothetical protein n=1 Tax=Geodermatophilus saharensis TaxID=1137994 RepID=UPI00114012C0|nr:hypothetical protein [Geodermatophilus saharensis]
MVAAGVLGLLLAAYTLVYALLLFSAVSISLGYAVVGAVFLGISGLAAVGAVQTLLGRGSRLLTAGGAAFALLTGLGLVTALVTGSVGLWPVVLLAVGVAVAVLPNRPASRSWFAAVRERR